MNKWNPKFFNFTNIFKKIKPSNGGLSEEQVNQLIEARITNLVNLTTNQIIRGHKTFNNSIMSLKTTENTGWFEFLKSDNTQLGLVGKFSSGNNKFGIWSSVDNVYLRAPQGKNIEVDNNNNIHSEKTPTHDFHLTNLRYVKNQITPIRNSANDAVIKANSANEKASENERRIQALEDRPAQVITKWYKQVYNCTLEHPTFREIGRGIYQANFKFQDLNLLQNYRIVESSIKNFVIKPLGNNDISYSLIGFDFAYHYDNDNIDAGDNVYGEITITSQDTTWFSTTTFELTILLIQTPNLQNLPTKNINVYSQRKEK